MAVLAVVMAHGGTGLLRGGFLGVDIFFVISGYVITASILADVQAGRFGLGRFYLRRAWRILPALGLLLAVSVPILVLVYPPDLAGMNLRIALAAALSVANLYLGLGPTPDLSAGAQPLLHLWSLGVEEQFYLVFPVLLVWALGLGRAAAWRVVAVVALLSFLWMILSAAEPGRGHYYLPLQRFWELLTGALVALRADRPGPALVWRQVLAGCGLALIGVSLVVFRSSTMTVPGPATVLPVLGTALVIACARSDTLVGRLLAWRPAVSVGLISYSLYLWHWMIFETYRQITGTPFNLGLQAAVGLSGMALLIAWASWRLVELPLRRPGQPALGARPGWPVTGHIAALVTFLLAATLGLSTRSAAS